VRVAIEKELLADNWIEPLKYRGDWAFSFCELDRGDEDSDATGDSRWVSGH
jgi:hypothetical protein